LIARKMEVTDNVIPSSNSTMAHNLFKLAKYFDNTDYMEKSKQMLSNVSDQMNSYLPGYSNWAMLLLNFSEPFYELAVTGKAVKDEIPKLHNSYLPNTILLLSDKEFTKLPLLDGKWMNGETTYFVCENKVCQLPVTDLNKALEQVKP